jgi:CBS domain-containing membrane protein
MKPLTALAAEDIMTRDVLVIAHRMSLRTAAGLLSRADISGAPVVNDAGRCIGVISSVDFLRVAKDPRGAEKRSGDCVCTPWQMIELDQVPTEEVSTVMSKDPVVVSPGATIIELAKMMTDAHIHRVVVVDELQRPVGIVSSTDIVAAVAREE